MPESRSVPAHDVGPAAPADAGREAPGGKGGVTVVIPTFNRARDVERALANLRAQPQGPDRVIVVDNSSTDGTAEMIAALRASADWMGRLHYVRKPPEGPASARNLGLAAATTEYVLFQDSDVELAPGWIGLARDRLEADPALAAVGGHILYAFDPGRINAYGGDLGWFGLAWDVDEGAPYDRARAAADRVWINCSAMLVRREAALDARGFDEAFFYGYEDTDLGCRLRILGHGVRVVPELVALHHVEAAPGPAHPDIVFHGCKNRLRMLLRNTGALRLPATLAACIGYGLIDLLLHAPRGARWRALVWNLRNLPATWALRRELQGRRVCSDAEVFAASSGRWFPPSRLRGLRRRAIAAGPGGSGAERVAQADDRV